MQEADLSIRDRALGEDVSHSLEQPIAELGDVFGLPVVVSSLGLAVVEERLLLRVRPRLQELDPAGSPSARIGASASSARFESPL